MRKSASEWIVLLPFVITSCYTYKAVMPKATADPERIARVSGKLNIGQEYRFFLKGNKDIQLKVAKIKGDTIVGEHWDYYSDKDRYTKSLRFAEIENIYEVKTKSYLCDACDNSELIFAIDSGKVYGFNLFNQKTIRMRVIHISNEVIQGNDVGIGGNSSYQGSVKNLRTLKRTELANVKERHFDSVGTTFFVIGGIGITAAIIIGVQLSQMTLFTPP